MTGSGGIQFHTDRAAKETNPGFRTYQSTRAITDFVGYPLEKVGTLVVAPVLIRDEIVVIPAGRDRGYLHDATSASGSIPQALQPRFDRMILEGLVHFFGGPHDPRSRFVAEPGSPQVGQLPVLAQPQLTSLKVIGAALKVAALDTGQEASDDNEGGAFILFSGRAFLHSEDPPVPVTRRSPS